MFINQCLDVIPRFIAMSVSDAGISFVLQMHFKLCYFLLHLGILVFIHWDIKMLPMKRNCCYVDRRKLLLLTLLSRHSTNHMCWDEIFIYLNLSLKLKIFMRHKSFFLLTERVSFDVKWCVIWSRIFCLENKKNPVKSYFRVKSFQHVKINAALKFTEHEKW